MCRAQWCAGGVTIRAGGGGGPGGWGGRAEGLAHTLPISEGWRLQALASGIWSEVDSSADTLKSYRMICETCSFPGPLFAAGFRIPVSDIWHSRASPTQAQMLCVLSCLSCTCLCHACLCGVLCSCGSGLTACVVALALHQVTGQLAAVYDGSWSEWGDPDLDTPVVANSTA